MNKSNLGRFVLQLARSLEISDAKIAEALMISRATVSQWRLGVKSMPDREALILSWVCFEHCQIRQQINKITNHTQELLLKVNEEFVAMDPRDFEALKAEASKEIDRIKSTKELTR